MPELGGPPLDYLLGNAVPRHPNRVAWLLAHGARADALNAYSKRPIARDAAVAWRQDLVDLLVAHGAERPQLDDKEQFFAAAMQGDAETLRRLAREHPDMLRDPAAMFAAATEERTDVAELLLDLGMSPDVGEHDGCRALHCTTHSGAVEVARLLIARGAEIDPVERCHHSTPLGHANYHGRREMIAVASASAARSSASRPSSPRTRRSPPAHRAASCPCSACLTTTVEVAELLLAHGADASVRDTAGLTPAQVALRRGLDEAADLLNPS